MRASLPPGGAADLIARIEDAARAHRARTPGDPGGRQPVHTVYVPGDAVAADTAPRLGREALALLDRHAPDAAAVAAAFGAGPAVAAEVRQRVAAKLAAEPVEDLRIDFEDGYGIRDDADEDRHAVAAANAVAEARDAGTLPPFVGLRVKSFAEGLHARSVRTLDGFLTALLERSDSLPHGFVITFPKVVADEHVSAFSEVLGRLEEALGLPAGALRFEIQVETTESVVAPDGRLALRSLVDAAAGRLTAAHLGVFDYTAACGLPGGEQRLDHPACDFARHVMQVSLAGTGVRLSDGSVNVVPADATTDAVLQAWAVHAGMVRHSLRHGFYQGWDLHPAHLVSRFAVVYAFHLDGLDERLDRLARWHGHARGSAGGGEGVLDEPATIRALTAALRRAVDCGALDEAVVTEVTGGLPL
jgi:hypothetical protein